MSIDDTSFSTITLYMLELDSGTSLPPTLKLLREVSLFLTTSVVVLSPLLELLLMSSSFLSLVTVIV